MSNRPTGVPFGRSEKKYFFFYLMHAGRKPDFETAELPQSIGAVLAPDWSACLFFASNVVFIDICRRQEC